MVRIEERFHKLKEFARKPGAVRLSTYVSIFAFALILAAYSFIFGSPLSTIYCFFTIPEQIETTCLITEIYTEIEQFSGGCGYVTSNYLVYMASQFTLSNQTIVDSIVCFPSYCLSASGPGCASYSCGTWVNHCGPTVTLDATTYEEMLNTEVPCYYSIAPSAEEDNFGYSYWTYFDEPKCFDFSLFTIIDLIVLIVVVLLLLISIPGIIVVEITRCYIKRVEMLGNSETEGNPVLLR